MVSFKGFDEKILTFKNGGISTGYPVCVNADSSVHDAGASAEFIGICFDRNSNEYVNVQVSGYIELPYTGSAPATGYTALVSDGNGGIKVLSSGKVLYKVIKVDTVNKIVGIIL